MSSNPVISKRTFFFIVLQLDHSKWKIYQSTRNTGYVYFAVLLMSSWCLLSLTLSMLTNISKPSDPLIRELALQLDLSSVLFKLKVLIRSCLPTSQTSTCWHNNCSQALYCLQKPCYFTLGQIIISSLCNVNLIRVLHWRLKHSCGTGFY